MYSGLAKKPGYEGRGLLARFLFLIPDSPLGYRKFEAHPIPESIRSNYENGLLSMLNWEAYYDEFNEINLNKINLSKSVFDE